MVYHRVLFWGIFMVLFLLVRDALNMCKDNKMGEK